MPWRRLQPMAMLAIFALLLSACGSDDDTQAAPETSAEGATAADESADAETDEPTGPSGEPAWFADHLELGDCWNDTVDANGDFDYSGVPEIVDCAEPHDNEVSAVWDLEGSAWPGDDELEAQADEICGDAFPTFVGAEYGTSAVDGFSLTPNEPDWNAGGRRSVCNVYVDTVAVVGTLEGIGVGARPFDFPDDAPIPDDAVLVRAGANEEGDRVLAFDVDATAEETVVEIAALGDAGGWEAGDVGAASRTTVIELTRGGEVNTVTVTAPEEPGEQVEVGYFYPLDER